ncbi:hypothetical protein EJB05_16479, partial [Eragrostis curvula]
MLPFLCVSKDDRLSIACVGTEHVVIGTKDDGDNGDPAPAVWLHTQVIQMTQAVAGANIVSVDCPKWFYIGKGAMLALYCPDGVFVLHLQKKSMEKIMDLSLCFPVSQGYYSCLPYEVDLPGFFMSRLGVMINLMAKQNQETTSTTITMKNLAAQCP